MNVNYISGLYSNWCNPLAVTDWEMLKSQESVFYLYGAIDKVGEWSCVYALIENSFLIIYH